MAIKINLLDWRTELNKLRERQFISLLVFSALLALTGLGGATFLVSDAVDLQTARNGFLKNQIAEVEKKIQEIEELEKVKASLLGRMQIIEELQASRSAMVHFFDEVVNTLPDGVYIKSIKQKGAEVTVAGMAESNGRVSAYMKNIESSEWFADPKLVVIKTVDLNKRRQSEFQLKFSNLTSRKPAGEASVLP
ncbi:MAG: PilN domain-containing protein [Nevskiales bacterium]|nr:PilN domain-containing protein [Nevskiales bacterium]